MNMNFKILEQQLIGKENSLIKCEDKIVISDHFACVIDGATSKSDILFDGKTQGKMAGELIENVINNLDKDATINSFISFVNQSFRNFYLQRELEKHMIEIPLDRLNASVAMFSAFRKEVWLIGDCQAKIGDVRITNKKLIDEVLSNLRSLVIELELIKGKPVEELYREDVGRNYIMRFLKEQHKFQNANFQSDFSFGVLDGFEINGKHFKKIEVDVSHVILASDGYPKIFGTLSETEEYLQRILETDPLCFKENKSTKGLQEGQISYDDRAFLSLNITS